MSMLCVRLNKDRHNEGETEIGRAEGGGGDVDL